MNKPPVYWITNSNHIDRYIFLLGNHEPAEFIDGRHYLLKASTRVGVSHQELGS